MTMGFGMAQEMMKQIAAYGHAIRFSSERRPRRIFPAAAQAVQTTAAPAATALQVYTPEQAAHVLGVDVADVVAELEAGTLKGRKIGANWRIAQAAIDEFLRG